jgi:hypothetical protein
MLNFRIPFLLVPRTCYAERVGVDATGVLTREREPELPHFNLRAAAQM